MNRIIKRTVTITITETWTIVWTAVDDPVPHEPVTAADAPKSVGEVPAALQANLNNTLPDQPTKGPGPETNLPAPGEMVQPPDEWPVSATAARRRKPVRRRRAKDKQNRNRHIEQRRKEMTQDAQTTLAAFRLGQFSPQPVQAVMDELRAALNEPDEADEA